MPNFELACYACYALAFADLLRHSIGSIRSHGHVNVPRMGVAARVGENAKAAVI